MTDLAQLARDLRRVHDSVLSGSRPPQSPRPLVARSWQRVLGHGLAADRPNQRTALGPGELERRRRESPLGLVIDDLLMVTRTVADASRFLMVVTDPSGRILWRDGSAAVRLRADRLGFTEGALWTEEQVGTNAIGTALAERAPVQLFAAEHFEQQQHPWYCTAHPVHDPRTGALLGVVDISGPALTLHPAVGALVETAVRLGESQLWRHHQDRLDRLRRSAEHVIATVSGPVLLVDDDGWVAHHAGVAVRDRVAAPVAGQLIAVPGLGLCRPERLQEGWLVRPTGSATLQASLDVGSRTLSVVGDESWRTALSPRHTRILQLLAAGPHSAASLSAALYGDGDHLVSVRAEISRLRRVVGGLIATAPYRLADGVALTVLP